MRSPTPLFLTRSINQHRKKYTYDGLRSAADQLLSFISPALYRCDHPVPLNEGVIQSAECEEPNFEPVFEVEIIAEQIIFSTDPFVLTRPFQRYKHFRCTTFGYGLGGLPR